MGNCRKAKRSVFHIAEIADNVQFLHIGLLDYRNVFELIKYGVENQSFLISIHLNFTVLLKVCLRSYKSFLYFATVFYGLCRYSAMFFQYFDYLTATFFYIVTFYLILLFIQISYTIRF